MEEGDAWGTPPEGSSRDGDERRSRTEESGDRRVLFPPGASTSNNEEEPQMEGHSVTDEDFHGEYVPEGRVMSVGIRVYNEDDVATTLKNIRRVGFNFVILDTVLNDEFVECKMKGKPFPMDKPFGWFDMDLKAPSDWASNIVLKIRTMEEHLEGNDMVMAFRAQDVIQKEFKYAKHLGISVLLCELTKSVCLRLAQVFNSQLLVGYACSVWVKIPMCLEKEGDTDSKSLRKTSSWGMWNQFRQLCSNHSRLSPVLELPADLPEDHIINRWFGEGVKAIFVATKVFMANSKGYPVLSNKHQQVLLKFIDLGAQVVINTDPHSRKSAKEHIWYREYINYIRERVVIKWDCYSSEMSGKFGSYEDFLQIPLQPLHDDLESQTYDCFEKDPVKYELYKEAVAQALVDRIPIADKDKTTAIVMVVGAGRGPLVGKTIEAAMSVKRNIRVYAVEKNFGAINTLRVLRKRDWGEANVTIVEGDMREWDAPEKADIIVSELLGSFGDNELSPECLDGAQKFLKPGGIMIPQSYTSYVCPVMSAKIWQEVRKSSIRGDLTVTSTSIVPFETPYVCNLRTKYEISEPMQVFHFEHPRPDLKSSNDRMTNVKFTAPQDCVVHGLLGSFESVLYGSVIMSIRPKTFSRGMFSWFPIYFPIRNPIPMVAGEDGVVSIWRLSSPNDVWYEWSVSTSHETSNIHNANGKSYKINLR